MGGASYAYDGMGNRIRQTIGVFRTDYLNDLARPLPTVVREIRYDDTVPATPVLLETNRFVHGPRGVHAQRNNASQWYWHTPDGLGSVRSVLDHTAAVLWATGYTPNGQGYAAAGTDPTLYDFTGEPSDANGLVYLRARHYSPALGQFINRDPAATFNRYAYVDGNPINRVDPSGLRYDDDFLPRPTLKPVTKPPKAPVTKPPKTQPPAVQPPVVKPPKTDPTPPSNPGSGGGGGSSKPSGKPVSNGKPQSTTQTKIVSKSPKISEEFGLNASPNPPSAVYQYESRTCPPGWNTVIYRYNPLTRIPYEVHCNLEGTGIIEQANSAWEIERNISTTISSNSQVTDGGSDNIDYWYGQGGITLQSVDDPTRAAVADIVVSEIERLTGESIPPRVVGHSLYLMWLCDCRTLPGMAGGAVSTTNWSLVENVFDIMNNAIDPSGVLTADIFPVERTLGSGDRFLLHQTTTELGKEFVELYLGIRPLTPEAEMRIRDTINQNWFGDN
jgi:RHS repeat-associated protein